MDEKTLEIVQRNEEQLLTHRINAVRQASAQHALKPFGGCHNCGTEFPLSDPDYGVRKFCDGECEQDWDAWYNAQKRKHGSHFTPRSAVNS